MLGYAARVATRFRCRVRHSGSIHTTSRSFNLADRDARHCCHGGQAGHTDGVPTNIDRRQGGGLECSTCVQKSKPAIHDDLMTWCSVGSSPTVRTRCGSPTCRTLHQRRHGALLRDAGCVFADDCGLVDRRPRAHQLGRRCPADGVLATATAAGHDLSWQPGQYTSWAFGHRLRQAGLPARWVGRPR